MNYFLLFFIISAHYLAAQEICNNGLDDDGNGFVDCFDPACCSTAPCASFYYKCQIPSCVVPPTNSNLAMNTLWQTDNQTGINVATTPIVGDVDGDGMPEVVGLRTAYQDTVKIYDGQTGLLEYSFELPINNQGSNYYDHPGGNLAIANVDADPTAEIFVNSFDSIIGCYNIDGSTQWETAPGFTCDHEDSPFIADFNQDGVAEYYVANAVGNAVTGQIYIPANCGLPVGRIPCGGCLCGGGQWNPAKPVAVDILPDSHCLDCAGLELVAGNTIYSIHLDLAVPSNSRITIAASVSGMGFSDGLTSVADIDQDGDLDVVVSGDLGGDTWGVYAWDAISGTELNHFVHPTQSAPCAGFSSYGNWGGQVLIANLDADPQMEMAYVTTDEINILETNLTLLRSISVSDNSRSTGLAAFDFNGDGLEEIVYRGESQLTIFNAATGSILGSVANCKSPTANEYPVIVDVNADGQTEIVVFCGSASGYSSETYVGAFKSAGTPWMPSRPVWNQTNYFNVNVNDDLTIPSHQQQHQLVGDHIVLNTFLKQYSDPQFATPDAQLTINGYVATGTHPDSIDVNVQICNLGSNLLAANTPIVFYDGNPTTTNVPVISTIYTIGTTLPESNCITKVYRTAKPQNTGLLYGVVNDNGSKPRAYNLATDFPVTSIAECTYLNNIATSPISLAIPNLAWTVEKNEQNQYTANISWTLTHPEKYKTIALQRSTDAISFQTIHEQPTASGNYQDKIQPNQFYYYRMVSQDKNDHLEYSEIKSIRSNQEEIAQWTLFPNPAQDLFYLYKDNTPTALPITVQIIDVMGQMVSQTQVAYLPAPISCAELPAGVYFVRVLDKEYKNGFSISFVKQP